MRAPVEVVDEGDERVGRMPVESLLMLPAGENTGLNRLGVFIAEGVAVALLDPPDMAEPARPAGGTGDSPRY